MKLLRRAGSAALFGAGLLAVMVLGLSPSLSQEQDRDEIRARMRGVFVSLTETYIYSLNADAFEDPDNHDKILAGLKALANGAEAFEAHTQDLDPSFDYMRRSLAHDASDALNRFEMGQYVGARWVLGKITENCVTCHSKLRTDRTFDMSREFLDEAPIQKLPASARAELQVALRQFDEALNTYEAMFRDEKMSWATLSLNGSFERYLRLTIVVRNEPERAIKVLRDYSNRKDLGPGPRALVENWVSSLKRWSESDQPKDELKTARETIETAQKASRYPSDRSQLVDFICSAELLHDYLAAKKRSDIETAEAYYLLAIAESHVTTSYWISETDFLLEQAIRKAPKSQIGRDAYDFLVAYMTSGHAMAREMPENLTHNLEELQALVEQ